MSFVVNTNLSSVVAQRNLSRVSSSLQSNVAKLSSGLRIVTAADDAAGLGLADKMRRDVRSLGQAQRNANDGVSMANAADGALREISNLLIRMRELAVQSLNDTNGTTERTTLDTEFGQLISEVDRIAKTAEFNGIKLLNTAASKNIHVGKGVASDDKITLTTVDVDRTTIGISTLAVTTAATASTAIGKLDSALDTINSKRGTFGAVMNRLQATVASLGDVMQATVGAESQIRDLDVASESATYSRNQIMQQAGVSVLAQANSQTQSVLRLLQ